jgi:3-oxoacyl-[acyl-carrier-protein] synthase-3
MTKINAAITGVGGFVPEDKLTNKDLEKMVDTNDEWIMTRTGIKERRILKGEGKATAFMCTEAAKELLAKTNTSPEEVDLIIVATITPDQPTPATANLVADALGVKNIISFDISAACSGFVYALTTATQFISSGTAKKAIVIGADMMSSIVDYTDRATCILFGDGAGAVMLEPSQDENGIQDHILKSDGAGAPYLQIAAGGSKEPITTELLEGGGKYLHQEGSTVFKFAVTNMANVSAEIMERNNLTGDDIAYLVPHQANKRIIDATAKRMEVGPEKVMLNIERYGNTTAATIPLCLWDYENKLKKGDNIVLAAFGAGFTWGSVYLKWAYDPK